jgi:hypothetical protein
LATDRSRTCPVCGTGFEAPLMGRPQKYCSARCRWRQGHLEVAEARRRWLASQPEQTYEELVALFERQDW